jgi:hypothetical protein
LSRLYGNLADRRRGARGAAFTIDSSQDLNIHSKIVLMIALPAGTIPRGMTGARTGPLGRTDA